MIFSFKHVSIYFLKQFLTLFVLILLGGLSGINANPPTKLLEHDLQKSNFTKQRGPGLYEKLLKPRDVMFDGANARLKPLSMKFNPENEILSLAFQLDDSPSVLSRTICCRRNCDDEDYVGILDSSSRFVAFLKADFATYSDDLFLWLLAWDHLNQGRYDSARIVYQILSDRGLLADPILERAKEWHEHMNSDDFNPDEN